MNVSEYAKHRDVSQPAISRLIKDGKLDGAYEKKGRYYNIDADKADAILLDNLDVIKKEAGNSDVDKEKGEISSSLHKVQLAKHYWRSQLLEFDARVKLGEYVKKVDTERVQYDAVRRFRDSLFSMLDRLIPVSVGKDEMEMYKIWRRELTKTLKELSEELKA